MRARRGSRRRASRSATSSRHSLAEALGIGTASVVAFVGAGGKTATVRALLRARSDAVATTTTHLAPHGFGTGTLVVGADEAILDELLLHARAVRPLTMALCGRDRLRGPSLAWHAGATGLVAARRLLLVECDGARQKLLKLPGPGEPCWHPHTDRAVLVLGLAALGEPLGQVAHRPASFGESLRTTVSVGHFTRMLHAYLALVPPHVPLTVLLTGVEAEDQGVAKQLARETIRCVRGRDPALQSPRVEVRVVASADVDRGPYGVWIAPRIRSRERVTLPGTCGVLLAAGSGTRFGSAAGNSKLLASWRGLPLVAHAARAWGEAGFPALRIVTGHASEALVPQLGSVLGDGAGEIRFVHNDDHRRGLGSSVRAAARAAPPGLGLFFGHADQPAVRVETLRRLSRIGATLRDAIVQPTVGGRPTNPVWFPAALRADLSRVPDPTGGKPVLEAHAERVVRIPMDDVAGEFADVDRPRDLHRLRRLGGRRKSDGAR